MSNEFAAIPNPDNVPGAVSTGYQLQNVMSNFNRSGFDGTGLFLSGIANSNLYLQAGSSVESMNNFYEFDSDNSLDLGNIYIYQNRPAYVSLKPGTGGRLGVEITDDPGVYNSLLNGRYRTISGFTYRVFNWVYVRGRLYKMNPETGDPIISIPREAVTGLNYIDFDRYNSWRFVKDIVNVNQTGTKAVAVTDAGNLVISYGTGAGSIRMYSGMSASAISTFAGPGATPVPSLYIYNGDLYTLVGDTLRRHQGVTGTVLATKNLAPIQGSGVLGVTADPATGVIYIMRYQDSDLYIYSLPSFASNTPSTILIGYASSTTGSGDIAFDPGTDCLIVVEKGNPGVFANKAYVIKTNGAIVTEIVFAGERATIRGVAVHPGTRRLVSVVTQNYATTAINQLIVNYHGW
jgi:hypothetical protein